MTNISLDRRDMFKGLLAISAAGALAACGGANEASEAAEGPVSAEGSGFFTASEVAQIAALADTIIPPTETGGAAAAGVPDTLQALATEWGDDGFRTYWRGGLETLIAALEDGESTSFTDMTSDQRQSVLSAHDTNVFDGVTEDGFYRDFKASVVQAYYMSEVGASEELAYEPVPGEFIGCVDLSEFPKTWAT
ncbi:MAG: hypothetical protein Hens2KO_14890 [Henriciella sp.]